MGLRRGVDGDGGTEPVGVFFFAAIVKERGGGKLRMEGRSQETS